MKFLLVKLKWQINKHEEKITQYNFSAYPSSESELHQIMLKKECSNEVEIFNGMIPLHDKLTTKGK